MMEHRQNLRTKVELTVECDLGLRKLPARTVDLSWAGLGLRTARPLDPGSLVRVALPQGPPVWAEAKWSRPSADGFVSGLALHDGRAAPTRPWVLAALKRSGKGPEALANQRRMLRVSCRLACQTSEGPGWLLDASPLGACVMLEKATPTWVELPDSDRLPVRVINRRGPLCHVAWKSLTAAQSAALGQFLRAHS